MPFLGDYLGHLLSEITIARVQADLETIRVAELYANHSLLRNLPVPHFRLPTMTLDVPVAVKDMEESKVGESPRGGVALPVLRERFDEVLRKHLERSGISLSAEEQGILAQALDQVMSGHAASPYVSMSVTNIADEFVATTAKSLRTAQRQRPIDAAQLERVATELRDAVRLEFVGLRAAPPRLSVLVTTAELREAGPSELLARLHLSISEEALEWSMSGSQGTSTGKLVPE
jgi:hypothetical protein